MVPVLITGPAAAVTVAEARASRVFAASDNDAYITLLLSIAQSQIDGWNGSLGRAVGLQTLEVQIAASRFWSTLCLPLPPFVGLTSDTLSGDGRTRTIRYQAGYATVPLALKHAIILMAGVLRDAVPDDEGSIRRETVDGLGSFEYSLPDGAADVMQKSADSLLKLYRVPRV